MLVIKGVLDDVIHNGHQTPENCRVDGLVQGCNNSSALAMELLQSCTKPSTCLTQALPLLKLSKPV